MQKIEGLQRALAVVLVLAACALVAALRPGEFLALKLLDAQFRELRRYDIGANIEPVAIVGIDETSVRAISEPMTLWHRPLAAFLHAMAIARPKAVGIDLVLPERSYDAVVPGSDKALLHGLMEARRSAPIVLAITKQPDGTARPIHQAYLSAVGEGNAAYALWPVDRDGVVRRFNEHLGEQGQHVPTLAGRLMQLAGAPLGEGIIDFARGRRFNYVSFKEVLDLAERGDTTKLEALFAGKVVLLGALLPFMDRAAMPVDLAGWETGSLDAPAILLYAQALRNAADTGFIREAPQMLVAFLVASCSLAWLIASRARVALTAFAALLLAALAGSTALLARGIHLPVVDIVFALAIAISGRYTWDTSRRLLERYRLRRSFSPYVSPAVLQRILSGTLTQSLGGSRKAIAILFADVRGFTRRSESMTPEEVIGMLNRYFERATVAIHAHGGTVDKFMGDGIMAFFGAPNVLPNACEAAVAAARDMVSGLAVLNDEFRREGLLPLAIGIGVHTGEAVVGHVGAAARHEYTAIGDAVNVASRLEGVTKDCGHMLVCSRNVFESLQDRQGWTYLGELALKGHAPVPGYGMFAVKGEAP